MPKPEPLISLRLSSQVRWCQWIIFFIKKCP